MMKKYLLLLLSLVVFTSSHAQTQQGYVKTKGRLTTNGTVIPGDRLSGATIVLGSRNTVTSLERGVFSFPTSGKNFLVRDIKKNGYQLYDRDQLKSYAYSSNPLILVLEKPEEYEQDKLQKQQQISRTLRRQLAKREDEIERLKEEKKISEAEYNRLYNELYTNEKKNQDLIEDMAKRYAAMDFDNMDETNLKIKTFILNGELERADSLINSKGCIEDRLKDYQKLQKANKQEEEAIAQRQDNLDKSKELAKKTLLDLAEDCFNKFEVCKLQNKYDSAAYYIEQRANLDSTNWEWSYEAAFYFYRQNEFEKSEKYYKQALGILKEDAYLNMPIIACVRMYLGALYYDMGEFDNCEILYNSAWTSQQQLVEEYPDIYKHDLALTLSYLGSLYYKTGRFKTSEKIYTTVLETQKQLAKENPQEYKPFLTITLSNLGELYNSLNKFSESEKMYKDALELCQQMKDENAKNYDDIFAIIQIHLGILYHSTKKFKESEMMYKAALAIFQRLTEENPKAYLPNLAALEMSIATLYMDTQRFAESETMYKHALDIYQKLSKRSPMAYEQDLVKTMIGLASLYDDIQRKAESETMYKEALDILQRLVQKSPNIYEEDLANIKTNLGALYHSTKKYSESETMYKESLDIYQRLAKKSPKAYESSLVKPIIGLASLYDDIQREIESETMYKEALDILQRLAKDNPKVYEEDLASIYINLALVYSETKEFQKAYDTHNEGIGLYQKLYQDGTVSKEDYALQLITLAFYSCITGKFDECVKYCKESSILNPEEDFAYTNLATAYLMLGKYKEAEMLYRKYKNKHKDILLETLKDYTEQGVIPKEREADVERIKQLLNE